MTLKCECPGSPYAGNGPVECPEDVTQEDGLCDPCRVRRCPEVRTYKDIEAADHRWFVHVGELMKEMP